MIFVSARKVARAKNKLRWWWIVWLCIHGIVAASTASRHNHHTNLSLILIIFLLYTRRRNEWVCDENDDDDRSRKRRSSKHETSDILCACMWRRYFRWWEVGLFYSSTTSFSPSLSRLLLNRKQYHVFLYIWKRTQTYDLETVTQHSQQHQYQLIESISSLVNLLILLQSQYTIFNFHRILFFCQHTLLIVVFVVVIKIKRCKFKWNFIHS